jgi:hypothetical protein
VRGIGLLLLLPVAGGCTPLLAGTEDLIAENPRDGCGGVAALADDFEDGATSDRWEVHARSVASQPIETDGELVIAAAAAGDGGGYVSRHAHDLRGGAIVVEVLEVVAEGFTTELRVEGVGEPGTERDAVSMVHVDGVLRFVGRAAAREEVLATVPYSAISHRFWRISERGGVIHLATARTATGPFDVAASLERLESFDQVVASLKVREESGPVIGGRSRFGGVSGEGEAAACPASRFVDDFEGDRLDRMWGQTSLTGCLLEHGSGALAIGGRGGEACELDLAPAVSLYDSSLTVQFRRLPADRGARVQIELGRGATSKLAMALRGSRLESLIEHQDGARLEAGVEIPSPDRARRWRIAGVTGTDDNAAEVRFEYSADGVSWSSLAQRDLRIVIEGAGVEIEAVNPLLPASEQGSAVAERPR